MSDQVIVSSSPVAPSAAKRWRTEDWIAVVLGFIVIVTTLAVFQWKVADLRSVVPNLRWTTDSQLDRKSTRLNSSHTDISRMPSSA